MKQFKLEYSDTLLKFNVLSLVVLVYFFANFNAIECQIENACRHNEFRCEDGSACLRSEKLCNGVDDCPNGEDELGNDHWDCSKTTLSSACGPKEFRCRFGGCIPKDQLCDGISQCWGSDDESIELCQSSRPKPRPRPNVPKQPSIVTTSRPTPVPAPTTTTNRPIVRPPRPPIQEEQPETDAQGPDTATSCRPPPIVEGSTVQCRHQNHPFNCGRGLSPDGTRATYSCRRYWQPPPTGSTTASITCKNGEWEQINRKWFCGLQCGVDGGRDTVGLIVGGQTSDVGKWPWHVGFYHEDPPNSKNYEYFCGGSLISRRAILTAAHCLTNSRTTTTRTDTIFASLGKYNRTYGNNDNFVQIKRISEIDVRSDYHVSFYENDIAVAWLDSNVNINSRVRPVCIANEEVLEPGLSGTLAGWGRWADRKYPEQMQETELPVIGMKKCKESHKSLEALSRKTTFCAGHRNGTSACDGDSGGGLMFEDRNKWYIQGIVSAGVPLRAGGCDPNHYTVFTRVDQYRGWIEGLLDKKDRARRR